MTIPKMRREAEVWIKTSEYTRTPTGMKQVFPGASSSPEGSGLAIPDHVVTCPNCGMPIPLFNSMTRPDSNIRCPSCSHIFRNPLEM